MWYVRFAILLLGLSIASVGVSAQKQIQLIATVSDPSGTELTTIAPSDVRVSEDGAAATVTKVEAITRVPKVQILVDNGIGMPAASLNDLRTAVRALLEALPPNLEVTIVTTAPNPRFLERATTDRQKLLSSIDRLTPDSGAGKFVESLFEATDRIEKDKTPDAAYTIFTLGTTSGEASGVRDSDLRSILERIQKRRTMVHVVILNSSVGRTSSGGIQTDLGENATRASGGRFEQIAVPNRMTTLLPEYGQLMAKSLGAGAKQIRVTVERPGGKSGDLGGVSLGVAGKTVTAVTLAN